MTFRRFVLLILLQCTSLISLAQPGNERISTKIAEGVYVIRHRNSPTGFPNGNTTVIIGDRQVFVVDSCYQISVAREDIAQIRQWTNKPVAYVLNTHWHNDHVEGNQAYVEAFPSVSIVAHRETKKDEDLYVSNAPARTERTDAEQKQMLASGKNNDGKPLTEEDRAALTRQIAARAPVIEEFKQFRYHSPSLVFDDHFTVDLGGREVRVMFLGRGNTAGDAIAFLPKERIVASGDLLVRPIPFVYDGYPTEWAETLRKLANLEPHIIVPGHGEVMYDTNYLLLVRNFLQSAVDQVNARLHELGPAEFHTVEEVEPSVDLKSFRPHFAGDDKELGENFDEASANLVKVVFKEAALR